MEKLTELQEEAIEEMNRIEEMVKYNKYKIVNDDEVESRPAIGLILRDDCKIGIVTRFEGIYYYNHIQIKDDKLYLSKSFIGGNTIKTIYFDNI